MKHYLLNSKMDKKYALELVSTPAELNSVIDIDEFVSSCTTVFFTTIWKELLKDSSGKSYGVYNEKGEIQADTQLLMQKNNIVTENNEHWPKIAWLKAEKLKDERNQPLQKYWQFHILKKILISWVTPIADGGFGGEYIFLKNEKNKIIGFTSYTVTNNDDGCKLAQQRYSCNKFYVNNDAQDISLEALLKKTFPNQSIGLYLGIAIAKKYQELGLGRALFDIRIQRMLELKADIIIGRTSTEITPQYMGNYLNRGMLKLASEFEDKNKIIMTASSKQLNPRQLDVKELEKSFTASYFFSGTAKVVPDSNNVQNFLAGFKKMISGMPAKKIDYIYIHKKIYFHIDLENNFTEANLQDMQDIFRKAMQNNIIKNSIILSDTIIINAANQDCINEIIDVLNEIKDEQNLESETAVKEF